MNLNQKGKDLIKGYEKCRLTAYLCPAGKPTIGWGNTFYEDGKQVKIGDKITQQRADELFNTIVGRFANDVAEEITSNPNDNQFSALVSFTYNCGILNLKKSTLLKKVNANPNDVTIRDEFMKWTKANGKELAGLVARRKAEADLYFTAV